MLPSSNDTWIGRLIETSYFGQYFILHLHLNKEVILEKMARRNIKRWCTVHEKIIVCAILCYAIIL